MSKTTAETANRIGPGERWMLAGAEVLCCADCPACLATPDLGARLVHHSWTFHTFVPGTTDKEKK